jgi:hypothetical protein
MSEVVKHEPAQAMTLRDKMDYAATVSDGSLVPQSYRKNPANVLIAMGLGESMGLSPIESLYRIDVIQGTPTAGAELIAANVRKAGHKLRVTSTKDSATAMIIRADDPEFPFEVTRDMAWARDMGLHTKDNYKKQAVTMLEWRAITAVARLACPEALYGVAYTPDELGDVQAAPKAPSAMDRLRQQTAPEPAPAPMEDLGERRDYLQEAEAADGDADTLRALWIDAKAAGEPQAHLDTIASMVAPVETPAAS